MSRSPYLSNPNILAHPDRIVQTVELDLTAQESYLAGSPINAEGKLANDETAIGILLYDVRKRAGSKRGVVVVSGRINQEAAAAWCGITISDAAKSALVNITFSDDGSRMGGNSGGVSSWNDIPDKPFGEETGLVEVLPETTIDLSKEFQPYMLRLISGDTYIVTVQGEEYQCVAQSVPGNGITLVCLGDIYTMTGGQIGTGPTGEPFAIMDYAPEVAAGFGVEYAFGYVPFDESIVNEDGTVTLSIAHKATVIKTIDPKFLPEGVPSKSVEEVRFVDNLTATSEYNENYGAFVVHLGMALEQMPLDGNCKVVWDGVTRTHPVVEAEIMGEVYHGFGNLSMFSSFGLDAPNTGEPYAVLMLPNRYAMAFTMDQSATEHTVTVAADDTVYHKMDQRYVGFPLIDLVAMGMPDLPQAALTNIPVEFETDTTDILAILARYDIVKVRYRIDGFDYITESTGLVTVNEGTSEREVAFFGHRRPYSIYVKNGSITGGFLLKD